MRENMKLLNIGCGESFHLEWSNIDLVAATPSVRVHDIRKSLPYTDSYFNACYSSHVIEHLMSHEAHQLVAETFRVLKSNGIFRVVVPDLELIAQKYLQALTQVTSGDLQAEPDYDWMMLELYDQTVRTFTSGEMGQYLGNCNIKNKEFVLSRLGSAAEDYWHSQEKSKRQSLWDKIRSKSPIWLLQKARIILTKACVRLIAGEDAKLAFDEGLFRNTGEIHRWMYDRFSLKRMLEQVGFVNVSILSSETSQILDFNKYNLDIVEDRVKHPGSIFMEGTKP